MEIINFKGNEVGIAFSSYDFKDYWKKVAEKYDKTYNIIEDGEVNLTVLNTNFARTSLYRYYYKNSENKTVYVIEQSEALGDEVDFTFYFSYEKIKDEDVKELIETVDKHFDF